MKKLFAFCIALMLAILPMGAAMAETIMIYGTVINTQPQSVVCTADGTIEQVNVTVGRLTSYAQSSPTMDGRQTQPSPPLRKAIYKTSAP